MAVNGNSARYALLFLLLVTSQYTVQASHKVGHSRMEASAHALMAAAGGLMELLRSDALESEPHRIAEHADRMETHMHALHSHGAVERHLRAQADALEDEHGMPFEQVVLSLIQENGDISEEALHEGAEKLSEVGDAISSHMGEAGDSFFSAAVWVSLVGVLNGITMGGMDMTQQLMQDPSCASQTRGIKRATKGVLEGVAALVQGELLDGVTHLVVSLFKLLVSLAKMLTCPTVLALIGILLVFIGVSMAASALGFGLAINFMMFLIGLVAAVPFVIQLVGKGAAAFSCTLSSETTCTDKHFLMMWETIAEFGGLLVGLWIASGVKEYLALGKGEGFFAAARRVKQGENVLDVNKVTATVHELRTAPQAFQRVWTMMRRLWGRRTLIESGGGSAAGTGAGASTNVGAVVAMQAKRVDELTKSLDEAQTMLDDAMDVVNGAPGRKQAAEGRLAQANDEMAALSDQLAELERVGAHLDSENAKLLKMEKSAEAHHAEWTELGTSIERLSSRDEMARLSRHAEELKHNFNERKLALDREIRNRQKFLDETRDAKNWAHATGRPPVEVQQIKLDSLREERALLFAAIDDIARMGSGAFDADGGIAPLVDELYDVLGRNWGLKDNAVNKMQKLSKMDDGGKAMSDLLNSGDLFAWVGNVDDLMRLSKQKDPSGKMADYLEMIYFNNVERRLAFSSSQATYADSIGNVMIDPKRVAPELALNRYLKAADGSLDKVGTYHGRAIAKAAEAGARERSVAAMRRLMEKGRADRVPSIATLKKQREALWGKYEAEWKGALEARGKLDEASAGLKGAETDVATVRAKLRALTDEAEALKHAAGDANTDKLAAEQVVRLQEKTVGVLTRSLAKAEEALAAARQHASVVRAEQGKTMLQRLVGAFPKQVIARRMVPESIGSRMWAYVFGSEQDHACWLGATAKHDEWTAAMSKWWYHVHIRFTKRGMAKPMEGEVGENADDDVWALSPYTYVVVSYRDAVAWTPVNAEDGTFANAGITLLTDSLEEPVKVMVVSATEELQSGVFNFDDASDLDEVPGQIVGTSTMHLNILPRGVTAYSPDEARKLATSVVMPVSPLRLIDTAATSPGRVTTRRELHLAGGVVRYAKAVSTSGAMPPVGVATHHLAEGKRAELKRDALLLFRFMNAFQWSGVDRLAFAVLSKWCTSERNTVALVATFDAVLKEKHEPVDNASVDGAVQTNLEYWLNSVMVSSEERCQAAGMLYRHAFDLERATEDC